MPNSKTLQCSDAFYRGNSMTTRSQPNQWQMNQTKQNKKINKKTTKKQRKTTTKTKNKHTIKTECMQERVYWKEREGGRKMYADWGI